MTSLHPPVHLNLQQLKSRAKDLRKAAASGDAQAWDRVRQHHPQLGDAAEAELRALSLQAAQLVLAREHGFDSWPRLTEALAAAPLATDAAILDALVGDSLAEVRRRLQRAAETGVPVLLVGKAAYGKRLAAQLLHDLSSAGGSLHAVDCQARQEVLAEADLFGYEEGAFTGARRATPGLLESAGTVLLHEVGQLSSGAQSRLLEALDSGHSRRLGGTEAHPVRARLVCTSSVELGAGFRKDLGYRLQVLRIDLPPLHERLDDVPALAAHFAAGAPHSGGAAPVLTDAALARLRAHPWPGNVRQLRHLVEAAALMAVGQITADDLRLDAVPVTG